MESIHYKINMALRDLMAHVLEPKLDLDELLALVARLAKEVSPEVLQARVYEADFMENRLTLRTSTQLDAAEIPLEDRIIPITPQTITGDAIIENRVIVATRTEGYSKSRFSEGEDMRAAFPIEFFDAELPEGRTKYVLVVDKRGIEPLPRDILEALKDYIVLAGLTISIKELRDKLNRYYEENRNLVLTGRHSTSIAHDIRSINVGVGGYLTMALKQLDKLEAVSEVMEARRYVALARDSAGQVEVLLGEFAQFNRTSFALVRDTDLAEAVAAKVDSLSSRLDYGQQVEFEVSGLEERTGVWVDRDWFGTVIENLVKNSVDASDGEAKITIKIVRNQDKVRLVFEDNCGGIDPQQLPKIFTPFSSSKKTGQGLGLANAKKVVNDHGGAIAVSNIPDQGARFVIEFKD